MRGRVRLTLIVVGALALLLTSCASEQQTEAVDEAADVATETRPPAPPAMEEFATTTQEPDPGLPSIRSIAVAHTSWVESKTPDKIQYDDHKLHIMSNTETTKRTYYYFEVPAHPDSIVSAEFVIDIEEKGDLGQVAVYSTNWDGAPVSWNSAPPQGAYLDHKSYTGGACRFDVSSAVTGPGPVGFLGRIYDESPPEQHADHYNPLLVITYNVRADSDVEKTDSPEGTP